MAGFLLLLNVANLFYENRRQKINRLKLDGLKLGFKNGNWCGLALGIDLKIEICLEIKIVLEIRIDLKIEIGLVPGIDLKFEILYWILVIRFYWFLRQLWAV